MASGQHSLWYIPSWYWKQVGWAEGLSGLSLIWLLRASIYSPFCLPPASLLRSPLPPPALPIITAITWSDEGEGMHSEGITMWVNSPPPSYSPNPPDAVLRSAYLLYTGFFSSCARYRGDKLPVWLVPVLPCLFSPLTFGIFVFVRLCVGLHQVHPDSQSAEICVCVFKLNVFTNCTPHLWRVNSICFCKG